MRAFQLVAWQSPLELRDVPVPEPGQILVKIGGGCLPLRPPPDDQARAQAADPAPLHPRS